MIDTQVQPILKAQEEDLKSKIPSFLQEVMPESPTKIFSDYVKTANPILKDKASQALSSLSSLANKATSFLTGTSVYNKPPQKSNQGVVTSSILDNIQNRENAPSDAKAVRHNSNGTRDYGLMQMNSSNIPFIKKEFQNRNMSFDAFNPNHSRLAAQILLEDNAKKFTVAMKRLPTDMELMSSYKIGLPELLKEARAKEIRKEPNKGDKYMKASILHE